MPMYLIRQQRDRLCKAWLDVAIVMLIWATKKVSITMATCEGLVSPYYLIPCIIKVYISTRSVFIFVDECQNKYGNANAWRYCCRVFDLLTVAAVSC